jgi:predicted alpha-1,2-mannosidase
MKNRYIFLIIGVFLFFLSSCSEKGPKSKLDYVNSLIGTESVPALSHGNVYPAVALPWGMNFWTPQTCTMGDGYIYYTKDDADISGKLGDGWLYYSKADTIRGFRQTHEPSPWMNDYGAFSIMPVNGSLKLTDVQRGSFFSHDQEIAKPNYYQVFLQSYGINTEITPTDRSALFRISYPKNEQSYLIIDAFHWGSEVTILPDKKTITGIVHNNCGGVPSNFANYFVMTFDLPIESFGTWLDGNLKKDTLHVRGDHAMAYVQFDTKEKRILHARISSSFISTYQAFKNMENELGSDSFETIRDRGAQTWEKLLGRINVEGGTERQKETFYSCMYRSMLFPRKFYELDSKGKPIYYSPYDGKIHNGYLFTDNGYWDTFRALHPFLTLVFPEISEKNIQGMLHAYDESGWLPEWSSPGHQNTMIGNNSISLITDAWMKGIRNFDQEKALEAMVHQTMGQSQEDESVGRNGFMEYNQLGYVPCDLYDQAAAKTLEYAYDDWCLSRFAQSTGHSDIAAKYALNAMNYKNVWDPGMNFMRGRNKDGTWRKNFDALEWGGPFTEGNAWHYTWSVFHDVEGLAALIGGHNEMARKLDSVFTAPNTVTDHPYGRVIHEMTEMVNANMGQYAHGNQPIQHMIYLYDFVGQPWKTQKWSRYVMDKLYKPTPDGFCGDEDNGQTSAWYILSAMGIYSVCPGANQFVIGSPLFKKVTIKLSNGKTFVVLSKNNSDQNIYIQRAKLNGLSFDKTYLNYADIIKGGVLEFEMGSEPSKQWGTAEGSSPYSMSNKN